jgi:hypothetical protein
MRERRFLRRLGPEASFFSAATMRRWDLASETFNPASVKARRNATFSAPMTRA